MKKQRMMDTSNLGDDTTVRDYNSNKFKSQSYETFGMITGEISGTNPEPLFQQTTVDVDLTRLGTITEVAYPGAFFDPESGNLHGIYEGPIKGQMVIIGFENGNQAAPFVVNRYPYQGIGDTVSETDYINPLTMAGFDAEDVIIGHYSGSYIAFYTGITSGELPGSVELNSATDLTLTVGSNFSLEAEIEAKIKSVTVKVDVDTEIDLEAPVVKLTANTQIELNGNTDYAVKYNELKIAFDQLKSDFNNFVSLTYGLHTHPYVDTPIGPSVTSPTTSMGTPSTADMSTSKNTKVTM